MLENPQHARHGAGESSSWIDHEAECGQSKQSATKLFNKLVAPWLAWKA